MGARRIQRLLSGLMTALGILGMALRWLLNTFALDWRQLLPVAHPLGLALGLVTVVALGLALYDAWNLYKIGEYRWGYEKSVKAFLGHLLAAGGIGLTVLEEAPAMTGTLGLVWTVLAAASIPCLAAAGWFRLRGKQPYFLLHLCPCIFLAVHTINQYQCWSSDPQLVNYIFSLVGIVCMVFFAFYRCAYDIDLPWCRRITFFGLASAFLGIVALPGCPYPWLYLGMAAWALTDRPVSAET